MAAASVAFAVLHIVHNKGRLVITGLPNINEQKAKTKNENR